MTVGRSVSSTSTVWVCSCGARDLSHTPGGADEQIEAHLAVCQESEAQRRAAAETLARRGRRR